MAKGKAATEPRADEEGDLTWKLNDFSAAQRDLAHSLSSCWSAIFKNGLSRPTCLGFFFSPQLDLITPQCRKCIAHFFLPMLDHFP